MDNVTHLVPAEQQDILAFATDVLNNQGFVGAPDSIKRLEVALARCESINRLVRHRQLIDAIINLYDAVAYHHEVVAHSFRNSAAIQRMRTVYKLRVGSRAYCTLDDGYMGTITYIDEALGRVGIRPDDKSMDDNVHATTIRPLTT